MFSIALIALALAVVAVSLLAADPAEARPGAHRHHHRHAVVHHVRRKHVAHHRRHHHARRAVARAQQPAPCFLFDCLFQQEPAAQQPHRVVQRAVVATASIVSDRVAEARKFLGQTARDLGLPRSLWCADFTNLVERRLGASGTGSRAARSFAVYGRPVSGPVVGAIAVLPRRGGGHVGIVSGVDANGNPILVSGNSTGGRVTEQAYPARRVIAYRM